MLKKIMLFIHSIFTTPVFYVFSGSMIFSLFFLGQKAEAKIFLISLTIMTVLVMALKLATRVPRPLGHIVKEKGYSFPSGHAAASAFLAVLMPFSFFNLLGAGALYSLTLGFLFLALLISTSRLVLRVHTPLQVGVGVCIGAFVPLIVMLAL